MTGTERVQIDQLDAESIHVPIIGTAPLICNNFSEKARWEMFEASQGKKMPKRVRVPEAEYEAAFYRILRDDTTEVYGFPVVAFKAATKGGARFYGKSISMTAVNQFIFMRGIVTKADPQQLVEIVGAPEMREDVVRSSGIGRKPALRFRPMWPEWSATLHVIFVRSSIDRSSVLSLIDAGGMGVGIGEWRPEKGGEYGTYAIDQTKKVEVDDESDDTGTASKKAYGPKKASPRRATSTTTRTTRARK